jgi:hypothetical protein
VYVADGRHRAARREHERRPRRVRFAAEVVGAVRAADAPRWSSCRADSAYYCGASHRAGARFLVTVNTYPKIAAVIIAITNWAPTSDKLRLAG